MRGGLPGPADRPMPRSQPEPEYPPPPGGPLALSTAPAPGYRPMPSERPADSWLPGTSAALDGTLLDGFPLIPDSPAYPSVPPYLSVRGHAPVPDWPPVPAMGVRRLARLVPRHRRTAGNRRRTVTDGGAMAGGGSRAAALGYLTVPVFVVPLVIYLSMLRRPGAARRHAAQAVNVWFTGALYDLAAVIMGAMLALDSPRVALLVFAPLAGARWLVTLTYLVRAARAASRGAAYAFPAWLCMRIAR